MRNRRFGVEIECGYGGLGIAHECNCGDCGYYDDRYDDEDHLDFTETLLRKNGFTNWTGGIHSDGSGVEIPSPVLEGQKGLNELGRVLKLLRENDYYVTREDGLHVHHEAPEFIGEDNIDNLKRLIETWANHQEVIDDFIADWRTDNHWACEKTWTPETVENFNKPPEYMDSYQREYYARQGRPYIPGGRGALNVHALWEHGTIEIRQMEGTLDFDVASAWIRFGQAFIDGVLKSPKLISCGNSAQLLKRIRVSEGAQKVLLAKAAA